MIKIDYDILFSIQARLIDTDENISEKIPPNSWRFIPTRKTLQKMKQEKMLFKAMDSTGLLLTQPTSYTTDTNGKEVAQFDFSETKKFIIEVRLNRPSMVKYIDFGPLPQNGNGSFPSDKKQFFEAAFPEQKPTYLLKKDRLKKNEPAVGVNDIIAVSGDRLNFEKITFSNMVLSGPLPEIREIPPIPIIDFKDGEIKEIENQLLFDYPINNIREGIYSLRGRKQLPSSQISFSGEVFLNGGINQVPPIAYLEIEIPADQYKAEQLTYIIQFKEKGTSSATT